MNEKEFYPDLHGISDSAIPKMFQIAEKMAMKNNIWFISEPTFDDVFVDEDKFLARLVKSLVPHRHVLLIDIEQGGEMSYLDLIIKWQEVGGTVIHCSTLSRTDVLKRILLNKSSGLQSRMLTLVPSVDFISAQALIDSFGLFGAFQKLMIDKNSEIIGEFFDIRLNSLKVNPSLAIEKED